MTASDTISAAELLPLLETPHLLLVDILTEDAFHACHLPGAQNFCTYEMTFIDKIKDAVKSSSAEDCALVIYGESDATLEAAEALDKLQAAGFANARRLVGGIVEWQKAGFRVEKQAAAATPVLDSTHSIDLAQSLIRWTGSNLFNHHLGTLAFASGNIAVANGQFSSGQLIIDLKTLRCDDLTDSAMNALLVQHLQSEDFFAMERFPTATFTLDEIQMTSSAPSSAPNARVAGRLLLRGVEKPVHFPALIAAKSDGSCVAQAYLTIDRTEWGVLYGSSKFFARLANHFVSDLLHLHLRIVTVTNKK